MHSAPSVSYPVGRSRVWALALGLAWLGGALLTGAWCAQADSVGWRQWLAVACVLAGAGVALAGWLASPLGELQWDGVGWCWLARGAGGEQVAGLLTVHLDLQRCLLIHLRGAGCGRRWLWLEQRREPARWDDLRRAVYSRARAAADEARAPLPG
ncbi:hypothetical protein [Rhodoferax sediminis]|uniref:Toxin CptA n=1 Tax=Rhodoferax sediminis TaxID=2509614 RepID=A0A515DEQ6_9BURK|nr:hypothetical protein [Rhodoferax sediminis]QDL38879.1 hypothetical protein EUB48_17475 [Rhodoferax sediminis]